MSALTVLLVVGGWYHWDRPQRMYWAAERIIDTDPEQAERLLEEAVALSSGDYPDAQLLWTRSLLRSRRHQEAIGCFSLIKAPQQLDSDKLFTLGQEAEALGMALLATNAFDAIPSTSPEYVPAVEGSLRLNFQGQKWAKVTELGEQLKNTDLPVSSEAWFMTAVSFERLAHLDFAMDFYRRFMDCDQDERDSQQTRHALRGMQRLSSMLGNAEESRRRLEQLRQTVEFTTADRVAEATLLRLEGQRDAATKIIDEVLSVDQSITAAIQLRGILALERGAWTEAETDFRHVVQVEPWNKQAHYKLAQALLRQGRNREAEEHFARNRQINEISARILELEKMDTTRLSERERTLELASAYEQLGRFDIAQKLRLRTNLEE